jgi:transcriptional regulator with XRE-family HTH domain
MALAMNLKRLRKRRGITQAELARRAGLTLPYIGRLEIGQHDPKLSTLRRLARALRVSLAELVE